MRTESILFAGVALFFAGVSSWYALHSDDPAGIAVLVLAFVMAGIISLFLAVQRWRKGPRPEDRREGEVRERSGPLDFFPPNSVWPVVTALGFAVIGTGIAAVGLWLCLIGFGITAAGVFGFAFQYARQEE